MRTRLHRLVKNRERGSFLVVFAVLAPAVLILAMFAIDQGSKIVAARKAETSAQEAARAAGQYLTPQVINGVNAPIDTSKAAGAARTYLREAGVSGTVRVSGQTVSVTTSVPWTPTVLGAIGVDGKTLTGNATARVARQ